MEQKESGSTNTSNIANTTKRTNHFTLVLLILLGFTSGFMGSYVESVLNSNSNSLPSSSEERQQLVLQESEIISEIVNEVEPSVVSIVTETTVRGFFTQGVSEGAGSGIILTEDGLVVTNSHVIPNDFNTITIVGSDGVEYSDVELIDRDPFTDIAYLQIDTVDGLVPAKLGNSSEMKVGEKVIAIGNALGRFDNTVTSGIISGLGRPIVASDGGNSAESLTNLFQTDAAINPGNSGGPLLNINGEVIGINTAVAEGENIGFAIPIDDVTPGIQSVKDNGELIKPYLGVRFITVTPAISEQFGLETESGAYLVADRGAAILPDSPASKAGLENGDVIISVDGVTIDDRHTLSSLIGRHQVGDTVDLVIERNDEQQTIQVELEAAPDNI